MNRPIIYYNNKVLELDSLLEIGEGWVPLVHKLYDDLVSIGWDTKLHQVKEKFGGLRFYIGYGNDEMFDLIRKAENESMKICELCGMPGDIKGKYWLECRCAACYNLQQKEE